MFYAASSMLRLPTSVRLLRGMKMDANGCRIRTTCSTATTTTENVGPNFGWSRDFSKSQLDSIFADLHACLEQPTAAALKQQVSHIYSQTNGRFCSERLFHELSAAALPVVRIMIVNCEALIGQGSIVPEAARSETLTAAAWMQAIVDVCVLLVRQPGASSTQWASMACGALVAANNALKKRSQANFDEVSRAFFASVGGPRMLEALYGPSFNVVDDDMVILVNHTIHTLNTDNAFHPTSFRQVLAVFLLNSRWHLMTRRLRLSLAENPPVTDERIRDALRGVMSCLWQDSKVNRAGATSASHRFVKRRSSKDVAANAAEKTSLAAVVEQYLAKGTFRISPFATMGPHRFSVLLRIVSRTRIFRSNLEVECVLLLLVLVHFIGRAGPTFLPISEGPDPLYTSMNVMKSIRRIVESERGNELLTDPTATKGALTSIDQLDHLIYEPLQLKMSNLLLSSSSDTASAVQWMLDNNDDDYEWRMILREGANYLLQRASDENGVRLLLLLEVVRHLCVVAVRSTHPVGVAALLKLQLIGLQVLNLSWESLSICTEMSRMHQFVSTICCFMKKRIPILSQLATEQIPRFTMAAAGNGALRLLLDQSGSEPLLASLLSMAVFLRFAFTRHRIIDTSPKCSVMDFARFVDVCLAPSIQRALSDVSPTMSAIEAHERVRAIHEARNVGPWISLTIAQLLRFARRELGNDGASMSSTILDRLPLDFDEPCADEIRRRRERFAQESVSNTDDEHDHPPLNGGGEYHDDDDEAETTGASHEDDLDLEA